MPVKRRKPGNTSSNQMKMVSEGPNEWRDDLYWKEPFGNLRPLRSSNSELNLVEPNQMSPHPANLEAEKQLPESLYEFLFYLLDQSVIIHEILFYVSLLTAVEYLLNIPVFPIVCICYKNYRYLSRYPATFICQLSLVFALTAVATLLFYSTFDQATMYLWVPVLSSAFHSYSVAVEYISGPDIISWFIAMYVMAIQTTVVYHENLTLSPLTIIINLMSISISILAYINNLLGMIANFRNDKIVFHHHYLIQGQIQSSRFFVQALLLQKKHLINYLKVRMDVPVSDDTSEELNVSSPRYKDLCSFMDNVSDFTDISLENQEKLKSLADASKFPKKGVNPSLYFPIQHHDVFYSNDLNQADRFTALLTHMSSNNAVIKFTTPRSLLLSLSDESRLTCRPLFRASLNSFLSQQGNSLIGNSLLFGPENEELSYNGEGLVIEVQGFVEIDLRIFLNGEDVSDTCGIDNWKHKEITLNNLEPATTYELFLCASGYWSLPLVFTTDSLEYTEEFIEKIVQPNATVALKTSELQKSLMSRTELISAIDDFKIQKKNLSLQVKKQKKEHAKANASLNLEIEKARKNLFRENQMYQKISHRINAIQESLSGFDFTIEFLETEKTLLTNLLDTDMVTTIAASYEQIQNEINDLKLQLEKNRYSIESLDSENTCEKESFISLKEKFVTLQVESNTFDLKLQEITKSINEKALEVGNVEHQIRTLESVCTEIDSKNCLLQVKLENLNETRNTLVNQTKTYRLEVDELNATYNSLVKDIPGSCN